MPSFLSDFQNHIGVLISVSVSFVVTLNQEIKTPIGPVSVEVEGTVF